MPVITINDPNGSGPATVGQMVTDQLEMTFVDRLVFTTPGRMMRIAKGQRSKKNNRWSGFATAWDA